MVEETPEERQARELEALDEQDDEDEEQDPETEYESEIRPGGDSTPQSPEWGD